VLQEWRPLVGENDRQHARLLQYIQREPLQWIMKPQVGWLPPTQDRHYDVRREQRQPQPC
jgi:hypothetical protein